MVEMAATACVDACGGRLLPSVVVGASTCVSTPVLSGADSIVASIGLLRVSTGAVRGIGIVTQMGRTRDEWRALTGVTRREAQPSSIVDVSVEGRGDACVDTGVTACETGRSLAHIGVIAHMTYAS